jgi:hypothetical protein
MIGATLANEVAKQLRTTNAWNESQCSVSPDGQPWAISPDFFVGVFPSEDSNINVDHVYNRYYTSHGFVVRISRRTRATPSDRYHRLYLDETKSLCTLAHNVRRVLLDTREAIRASVNAEFTEDNVDQDICLVRTFNWISTDSEIMERESAWFRSSQDNMKIDTFNPAGFSIDINFGNAMGCVEAAQ